MSFGWSAGDVANLVRLAYEVYNHCRNAPEELRGLVEQLDRLHHKLEQFHVILERSGVSHCDGLTTLEQHLLAARETLRPLQSSKQNWTFLLRMALKRRRLVRVARGLDTNERELQNIKVDLILICSLQNLRLISNARQQKSILGSRRPSSELGQVAIRKQQPGHTAPSRALIAKSEGISIEDLSSTELQQVLEEIVASRSGSRPGGPQLLDKLGESNDKVCSDVAAFAEHTELYVKSTGDARDPATMSAMISSNPQRPDSVHTNKDVVVGARSEIPTTQLDSSHSKAQNPPALVRAIADGTETRLHFTHLQDGHSPATWSAGPPSSSVCSRRLDGAEVVIYDVSLGTGSTGPGAFSEGAGAIRAATKLQSPARVVVNSFSQLLNDGCFDLEVSEEFTTLRMLACSAPVATSTNSQGAVISQHRFDTSARPIPHLLHPGVEGTDNEPDAPYTISFARPQYVSTQSEAEPFFRTDTLLYVFHDQQDRIKTCEQIFGKVLVTVAGCKRIKYKGRDQSHMCAMVMWFDVCTRSLSITFSRHICGDPADVELKLHGLWSRERAQTGSNIMQLAVGQLTTPRKIKGQGQERFECMIHFSSITDKTSFATCLKQYMPA